jgi:hypothetical protein
MSPYLLSQLPLVIGLFALVGLSSLRPWKNDRASAYLAIGAILVTLYYVWLLPVGAEYFGGSIRITNTRIRWIGALCRSYLQQAL